MKNSRLILDSWLGFTQENPITAYLDVADWELFVKWVGKDLEARSKKLQNHEWHIIVLGSQLMRFFGKDLRRDKLLKSLGVDFDKRSTENDERFIAEILKAYFHNDNSMRQQAELLAFARRNEINGKSIIISQHKSFWRIPDVDTYFIDESCLLGFEDLPAGFDFFVDMKIHRKIMQASSERINAGENPFAIIESVKTLFEEVRLASHLDDDGYSLMVSALSCNDWDKKNPNPTPLIKFNECKTVTDKNDQKGYKDIACGIATALRNPIAHQPVDQAFIQDRYGDKRSTLKVLCMLSLLLEKIDKRVV